MSMYGIQSGVPQWVSPNCNAGCSLDSCPDFVIKRHDTKPPFKVAIESCTGLPSEDISENADYLVAEVSMWGSAKLKRAITAAASEVALADNVGFDQVLVGDIIVMDRVRSPEQMVITGFDEVNKTIQVSRGSPSAWPKGTGMRIFRIKDAPAAIERKYEDIINNDGTVSKDQLVGTYLVYEWQSNDTCVPGCFTLEFKLLQMLATPSLISTITDDDGDGVAEDIITIQPVVPTPSIPSIVDYSCSAGLGVDWVRRYPQTKEGFSVQIIDSPTAELS